MNNSCYITLLTYETTGTLKDSFRMDFNYTERGLLTASNHQTKYADDPSHQQNQEGRIIHVTKKLQGSSWYGGTGIADKWHIVHPFAHNELIWLPPVSLFPVLELQYWG